MSTRPKFANLDKIAVKITSQFTDLLRGGDSGTWAVERVKRHEDAKSDGTIEIQFGKSAKLTCEIASSPAAQTLGLQKYASIPMSHGMVFPYPEPKQVSFHMADVQFPIDIIFVGSDNRVTKIVKSIEPGSPGKWSMKHVSMVVESNGGFCDEYGVEVGTPVSTPRSASVKVQQWDELGGSWDELNLEGVDAKSDAEDILAAANLAIDLEPEENDWEIAGDVSTQDVRKIKLINGYGHQGIIEIDLRNQEPSEQPVGDVLNKYTAAHSTEKLKVVQHKEWPSPGGVSWFVMDLSDGNSVCIDSRDGSAMLLDGEYTPINNLRLNDTTNPYVKAVKEFGLDVAKDVGSDKEQPHEASIRLAYTILAQEKFPSYPRKDINPKMLLVPTGKPEERFKGHDLVDVQTENQPMDSNWDSSSGCDVTDRTLGEQNDEIPPTRMSHKT